MFFFFRADWDNAKLPDCPTHRNVVYETWQPRRPNVAALCQVSKIPATPRCQTQMPMMIYVEIFFQNKLAFCNPVQCKGQRNSPGMSKNDRGIYFRGRKCTKRTVHALCLATWVATPKMTFYSLLRTKNQNHLPGCWFIFNVISHNSFVSCRHRIFKAFGLLPVTRVVL